MNCELWLERESTCVPACVIFLLRSVLRLFHQGEPFNTVFCELVLKAARLCHSVFPAPGRPCFNNGRSLLADPQAAVQPNNVVVIVIVVAMVAVVVVESWQSSPGCVTDVFRPRLSWCGGVATVTRHSVIELFYSNTTQLRKHCLSQSADGWG